MTHHARGAGCPPWALFSHWRNHCLRGDLSVWCCTILGKGQWNQCIAAPFTLLMQSVLVFIVKLGGAGGFSFIPWSRIYSIVSCPWIVVSCDSFETACQECPMLPSWWHHSHTFRIGGLDRILLWYIIHKYSMCYIFSILII